MKHDNPNAERIDKRTLSYTIGGAYRYHGGNREFILQEVIHEGTVFRFECGHWCTDNVFVDLIQINHKSKQLELF